MRINPSAGLLPPAVKEKKMNSSPATFGELFQDALNRVNRWQLEAEEASRGIISGEIEDLHQVMIAAEKARLSLQLTVQVTNKVIEAYREIVRMQL